MPAGQPTTPAWASTTSANPISRSAAIPLNARSRGGRTPDLFEPHTARDWLMLSASGVILVGLVGSARLRCTGVRDG